MAYSVQNKCNNARIKQALDVILSVTPTESYPNGNGGYNQSAIHQLADDLKAFGITLECVSSGDAYSVGSYCFTSNKKASSTLLKKLRSYVVNLLIAYIQADRCYYRLNCALRKSVGMLDIRLELGDYTKFKLNDCVYHADRLDNLRAKRNEYKDDYEQSKQSLLNALQSQI